MTTDLHFIILVAGSGTRNYPHSKGLPHKALLPFGDFKVIDQIMKKLVDAGGRKFTFVVSCEAEKGIFDQCFACEPKVEEKFTRAGKDHLVKLLTSCYLPEDVSIDYVVQEKPLGVGHAVALAAGDDEDVAMILPDDLILSTGVSPYRRAVELYKKNKKGTIVITREVEDPSRWGIVENGFYVEKPKTSTSKESIIALQLLDREVIADLKQAVNDMKAGKRPEGMPGKELYQVHSINKIAQKDPSKKIQTIPLLETDTYLDCGSIEGYEKALIYTLVQKSIFKDDNMKWVKSILGA